MKTKDICLQYGFDLAEFERFIYKNDINHKNSLTSMLIDDEDVKRVVGLYSTELERIEAEKRDKAKAEEQARLEAERAQVEAQEEEEKKRKALAEMLITSGFNFDGYKITKYSGYISGDDCVTMPRDDFWGSNKVSDNLCGALVKIRRQAIKELKEAAYNLGCNAVIGVDFDYLTMDPQHAAALNAMMTVYEPYVICVTANGNAVVIEKE